MCRLFPPELIEAIATGDPPPAALKAVARHIQGDWLAAAAPTGAAGKDLARICDEMAWAAVNGSGDADHAWAPLLLPGGSGGV